METGMKDLKIKVVVAGINVLNSSVVLNASVGVDGNMRDMGNYRFELGQNLTVVWPVDFFEWADTDAAQKKVIEALKTIKENL